MRRTHRLLIFLVSLAVLAVITAAPWALVGPNKELGNAEKIIDEQITRQLDPLADASIPFAISSSCEKYSLAIPDLGNIGTLDVSNQSGDRNETLMRAPVSGNDPLPLYLVTSFSIVIGIGVIVALSWPLEILIVPFWSALILLYARLADKDPLDNYRRGLIHGFVLAHPGVSFSELRRGLNIPNGPLVYHIHVLEKERLIRSRRAGNLLLFYSSDADPKMIGESMWTDLQLKILKSVAEAGEMTKADIRRMVGCSHQLLHYNIKRMVASEVLVPHFQNGRKYFKLGPGYDESAIMDLIARKQGDNGLEEEHADPPLTDMIGAIK